MSHTDTEFAIRKQLADANNDTDDKYDRAYRGGASQVELDMMTTDPSSSNQREQPDQGIHEPRHEDTAEQDMDGGDEEYRAVEEVMHGMEGNHGEGHMSLAEAEAARGEGEGQDDARQHDEDHGHDHDHDHGLTHDRLHILAEQTVDASHGPPPSMAEQLDRQHLQHAGDLLSFASLGAGPSGDPDGFGRIFADQAHEQTAEMGDQPGMHEDGGEYQVDLNTEGYPPQAGDESGLFEPVHEGQDVGDGMNLGEMGSDQVQSNPRKRKRRSPKPLNQDEIENKKAAHKEIERKRRHNIAAGVEAIAGILPNGDKEKYKGQILFRAVEYMQQLQKDTVRLPELEARNVQLEDQLEQATSNMPGFQGARIEELERQNQVLRQESEDQARKWALEKGVMEDELMSLRAQGRGSSADKDHHSLTEEYHRNWRNEENRANNLVAELERLKAESKEGERPQGF